jgi:hypothetical protein
MAQEYIIELEAKTEKALKEIEKLTNQVDDLTQAIKDQTDQSKKGQEGMAKTLKGVANGFRGVGLAMKAAGFGIIMKAVDKLTEVFMQNQTVVDGVSVVFETINQVFTQVTNALEKAYKNVKEATGGFDALGKVLSNLLKLGLTPLKASFFALKLGIQEVQYAWEKFIGGADPEKLKALDSGIQETKDSLKEVANEAIEAGAQIGSNILEAIDEVTVFAKEAGKQLEKVSIEAAVNNAKTITELRKQAELAEVVNARLLQQYDQEAEIQRQLRDDTTKSIAERQLANKELGRILEEQAVVMLKNANANMALASTQYSLNKSTENLIALENSKRELADINAMIEGKRSEQKINEIGLNQELLDIELARTEGESRRIIEGQRANAELIDSALLKLEIDKQILLEERKIEEERLKFKRDLYAEGTQARVDAENELADFLLASKNAELQIDKATAQEKLQIIMGAMSSIATLVGESTAFGKAIAITQAVIDTYAGANKALAQGGIFGGIAAAGIIASGLANVKKIISTEPPAPPAGLNASTPSGASVSTGGAPSLPPQFNVVGASGISQIADVLGQNSNKAVKAYVVSKDVSTAQELDRNIVNSAKFG